MPSWRSSYFKRRYETLSLAQVRILRLAALWCDTIQYNTIQLDGQVTNTQGKGYGTEHTHTHTDTSQNMTVMQRRVKLIG